MLQTSGLIIFSLFAGFYFYGVWGGFLAFCLSIGVGYCIRYIECKYLNPARITPEEEKRSESKKILGTIVSLLCCLAAFIALALKIK